MRIIAGKHRGRPLRVPHGAGLRPTADRVREAVFNILAHNPDCPAFEDAVVFDIFAGTGAYGLEALSRGAALAVFVDRDPLALRGIQRNAATLNEVHAAVLLRLDAARLSGPPRTARAPGIVAFLDPPYELGIGRSGAAGPEVERVDRTGRRVRGRGGGQGSLQPASGVHPAGRANLWSGAGRLFAVGLTGRDGLRPMPPGCRGGGRARAATR